MKKKKSQNSPANGPLGSTSPPPLRICRLSPSSPFFSHIMAEQEEQEEQEVKEENPKSLMEEEASRKKNKRKKKQRLLQEEAATADKRGVCYLSRIPPHMDPLKLRQILSHYGDIQRIYLTPENPSARVHRKRAGGFRGQGFSEGWVEFTKRSVAKRVAKMLNGEQIGGRKRSSFYYDLWNIKYLSKFKWDDLTEEIAYKNATREQKLALEISAAKRERDFYLSKVDQSLALSNIEERLKKKRKVLEESGAAPEGQQQQPKVIRQFPQTRPVSDNAAGGESRKRRLSKDILAGMRPMERVRHGGRVRNRERSGGYGCGCVGLWRRWRGSVAWVRLCAMEESRKELRK
ncbi:hypothetical protein LguiA_019653 [Lonicera macranthoides]